MVAFTPATALPASLRLSPLLPPSPSLCSRTKEFPASQRFLQARKPGKERLSKRKHAPADLRKDAGAFDLPIAMGMLVATRQILPEQLRDWAMVGELALDGTVRPIKGALSMAMSARDQGIKRLLVPKDNAREAAVVSEVAVFGVGTLNDAVGLITGHLQWEPVPAGMGEIEAKLNRYEVDFSDVRGQEFAKRALVVAAAGGHNVLMIGSPGTGKTMLARRLPTILPPLTPHESLETTRIYSAMGRLAPGESLLTTRPFRSPHHTISDAGWSKSAESEPPSAAPFDRGTNPSLSKSAGLRSSSLEPAVSLPRTIL